MKQFKLIIYALCALSIISIFFPWLTASSSFELSGIVSGGQSASVSTSGIMTGQGFLGFIVVLAAIFMTNKDYKWSFVPAAINTLIGLSLLFFSSGKQFSSSSSISSEFGSQSASGSAGLYPAIGLYIFLVLSVILLILLLIKEFQPGLLNGSGGLEGSVDGAQLKTLLMHEYILAAGILVFMFWLNQKVGSSLNGFTDLLLALVFFVAIPYFLAKKADFKLVQNLVLSFTGVYVLLALLGFLNIYTYRYAVVDVAKSFFAITLLALAYEFIARKKADVIPQKVHDIIQKLDLKKISVILLVIVALACVKLFVTNRMAQSAQQETAQVTEDTTVNEPSSPEPQAQVEEQVQTESTDSAAEAAPTTQAPSAPRGDYSIIDPDGYTNLRATPGGKIIRKVYENETFDIIEPGEPYSKIKLTDGTVGYMHNSRITSAN